MQSFGIPEDKHQGPTNEGGKGASGASVQLTNFGRASIGSLFVGV